MRCSHSRSLSASGGPFLAPSATRRGLGLWPGLWLVAALAAAGCGPSAADHPLAADIGHWSAVLRSHAANDRDWVQIQQSAQPGLDSAREALRHGRRELALARLAGVRVDIGAAAYVRERSPEQRQSTAAFAAEWKRMRGPLGDDHGPPSPAALAGVRSGIEMQGWHALALIACGLWAPRGGRLADCAAAAFVAGTLLFCGGVYAVGDVTGGLLLAHVAGHAA